MLKGLGSDSQERSLNGTVLMGSRLSNEINALCAHEPGVAPAVPAGHKHSLENASRGSHGVTSPTFQFMGSSDPVSSALGAHEPTPCLRRGFGRQASPSEEGSFL